METFVAPCGLRRDTVAVPSQVRIVEILSLLLAKPIASADICHAFNQSASNRCSRPSFFTPAAILMLDCIFFTRASAQGGINFTSATKNKKLSFVTGIDHASNAQ
jgi:hypothetical protein